MRRSRVLPARPLPLPPALRRRREATWKPGPKCTIDTIMIKNNSVLHRLHSIRLMGELSSRLRLRGRHGGIPVLSISTHRGSQNSARKHRCMSRAASGWQRAHDGGPVALQLAARSPITKASRSMAAAAGTAAAADDEDASCDKGGPSNSIEVTPAAVFSSSGASGRL